MTPLPLLGLRNLRYNERYTAPPRSRRYGMGERERLEGGR